MELDRTIRGLRGPKDPVDARQALGTLLEQERAESGRPTRALTLFLAGAECPFTCAHCDLWRYTLDGPTPAGAIPTQIRRALDELAQPLEPAATRLKLYNASNFFERRAVPPEDDAAIAEAIRGFGAVTVENHPRLVGDRCFRFAEAIGEGRLEVAMGLETADPAGLEALNKSSDLHDFDAACVALQRHDIDIRAFVLLGTPEVQDPVADAVASTLHALEAGARLVALNPVRPGNGYLERLQAEERWRPPTLAEMETVLSTLLAAGPDGIVMVDLWEIGRFARCADCHDRRVSNLAAMNATGVASDPVRCEGCAATVGPQR